MKLGLTLLSMLLSTSVFAAHGIDVYGLNAEESKKILQHYEKRIALITDKLHEGISKDFNGFLDTSEARALTKQRKALIEEIKQREGYLYVNLSTVYYSKKNYYTTIEVVKPDQKARLQFLGDKTNSPPNYPKTHDIMDKMDEYRDVGHELFIESKIQPRHDECPVYHCTMGFDHPKLKPYLALFNHAAKYEKQFILNTLNQDPNPDRRASAAYLVGHFNDPHDIISVLLPHVKDKDAIVRNNAIRVISLTALKAHIMDLDPAPFVALLDSPEATDRNKSLFLLTEIAKSKQGKSYLIHHAETPLINILAMKQPNQQEFAYMIMKEISGKDFGEHNVKAWASWFEKAKITAV